MNSKQMEEALNSQINAELYSSYLYLSMSGYFKSSGLAGFAHWMRLQAQEELLHSIKIFDFVNERGGKVVLDTIKQPPTDWSSARDVFEDVMKHEKMVTALINDLVDLALVERDHASNIFLQWFVNEQVEEEASVGSIIDKLKLIGHNTGGLFALDQEMATRIPPQPPV